MKIRLELLGQKGGGCLMTVTSQFYYQRTLILLGITLSSALRCYIPGPFAGIHMTVCNQ